MFRLPTTVTCGRSTAASSQPVPSVARWPAAPTVRTLPAHGPVQRASPGRPWEGDVPGRHPLDLLTPEEAAAAVALVRARPDVPEGARVPIVRVAEPSPAELAAWAGGADVPRRLRVHVVKGAGPGVVDAVIDLDRGAVDSWDEHPDQQPALMVGEAMQTIQALRADPRFQEAIRRRGIEDVERVQIDPWPPG